MIRGEFLDGRPHIRGLFQFDAITDTVRCNPLVDTGSDVTMVMPTDYERAGLAWSEFSGAPSAAATGVGGFAEIKIVGAILFLFDPDDGRLIRFHTPLNVAPPTPEFYRLPSLLGRDITDHFRLVIDPTNDLVALDDPELYR